MDVFDKVQHLCFARKILDFSCSLLRTYSEEVMLRSTLSCSFFLNFYYRLTAGFQPELYENIF